MDHENLRRAHPRYPALGHRRTQVHDSRIRCSFTFQLGAEIRRTVWKLTGGRQGRRLEEADEAVADVRDADADDRLERRRQMLPLARRVCEGRRGKW